MTNLGYNTKKYPVVYNEQLGGHIVEYDYFVSNEVLNDPSSLEKQARLKNLVACDKAKNIRIKNNLPQGLYRRAFSSAIKELNAVKGSFLK